MAHGPESTENIEIPPSEPNIPAAKDPHVGSQQEKDLIPEPDVEDSGFPGHVDDERRGEISRYFGKADEKGTFERDIFTREESVYRLDREGRAETDPAGIDPVHLLSENLRKKLLGSFIKQDFGDFPYPAQALIDTRDLKSSRDNTSIPAYLHYSHGDIRVRHEYPNSIEAILVTKDTEPISARWRIAAEVPRNPGEKQLLNIDIEAIRGVAYQQSYQGVVYREGRRITPVGVRHEKDRQGYSIGNDPALYLAQLYTLEENPVHIKNGEEDFVALWEKRFGQLRLNENANLYPGQLVHTPTGLSLDIFEGAIAAAETHGYGGITATPDYFHSAEHFEKQGLSFEREEDQIRMDLIKLALRAIDEQRYEEALRDAIARGVSHQESVEFASGKLLTPQERSWIVLLNSVRNQDLIPSEWNLGAIAGTKIADELTQTNARLEEARRNSHALHEKLNAVPPEKRRDPNAYQDVDMAAAEIMNSNTNLQHWMATSMRNAEQELGVDIETVQKRMRKNPRRVSEDYEEFFIDEELLEELNPSVMDALRDYEFYLSGRIRTATLELGRLDAWRRLAFEDVGEANSNTFHWAKNRMSFRFEAGAEKPFNTQRSFDNLIGREIITGNTLYQEHGFLGKYIEQKKRPSKYAIVYHMYERDGMVKQPDDTLRKRENQKHFKDIQDHMKRFGFPVKIESALGNVKNPGPNRPLGWQNEEPSTWVDPVDGIERSSQRALTIQCKNISQVETAIDLFNKVGYKEHENETGTDPAWFVPDIRVLGIAEAEYDKLPESSPLRRFSEPAIMHVKKGGRGEYGTTLAHESHRMVAGFTHVPVLIHKTMGSFIRRQEERLGAYQFVSK